MLSLPVAIGAGALVRLGERTRALEWCARALAIAPDDPLTLYNVACSYALLGEMDLSARCARALAPRANARTKSWVRGDTDFDGFRGHPRFQEFLNGLE